MRLQANVRLFVVSTVFFWAEIATALDAPVLELSRSDVTGEDVSGVPNPSPGQPVLHLVFPDDITGFNIYIDGDYRDTVLSQNATFSPFLYLLPDDWCVAYITAFDELLNHSPRSNEVMSGVLIACKQMLPNHPRNLKVTK